MPRKPLDTRFSKKRMDSWPRAKSGATGTKDAINLGIWSSILRLTSSRPHRGYTTSNSSDSA